VVQAVQAVQGGSIKSSSAAAASLSQGGGGGAGGGSSSAAAAASLGQGFEPVTFASLALRSQGGGGSGGGGGGRKRTMCPHGKRKERCIECGGSQVCIHGKLKDKRRPCARCVESGGAGCV
jgi:hypothetical protein